MKPSLFPINSLQNSIYESDYSQEDLTENSQQNLIQNEEASNEISNYPQSEKLIPQDQVEKKTNNLEETEKLGEAQEEQCQFKGIIMEIEPQQSTLNESSIHLNADVYEDPQKIVEELDCYDKRNLANLFGNLFLKNYQKQVCNHKIEKWSLKMLSNIMQKNDDFRQSAYAYLESYEILDDILSSEKQLNVTGPLDQINWLHKKLRQKCQITQFKPTRKRKQKRNNK